MATNITNSEGDVVVTVADGNNDVSTPLNLIGVGYSGYAPLQNNNFYNITENFRSETAPNNPIPGMDWYKPTIGPQYFNGTSWVLYATGVSTDIILSRLETASDINFNAVASHNLHTGAAGVKTLVSSVIIVPQTGASVAGLPPQILVEVANGTGDIADKIVLSGLTAATKFFRFNITGSNRIVEAGDTVKLNITSAITGPDVLVADVYLMGVAI